MRCEATQSTNRCSWLSTRFNLDFAHFSAACIKERVTEFYIIAEVMLQCWHCHLLTDNEKCSRHPSLGTFNFSYLIFSRVLLRFLQAFEVASCMVCSLCGTSPVCHFLKSFLCFYLFSSPELFRKIETLFPASQSRHFLLSYCFLVMDFRYKLCKCIKAVIMWIYLK